MKNPRLMLAACASGSGKTMITCGLLQALVNRSLKVASFKCGPDYIDPMFHTRVIGTPSRNLDPFFTDGDTTRFLLNRQAEEFDLSVLEGVMGFYDGIGGTSLEGSTYQVADVTDTPVVLVINTRGMSGTVVPLILGMAQYVENSHIKGVILNQMSAMIYPEVKAKIESECAARGVDLKVYGYVPVVKDLVIESRHLGLVTPNDVEDLKGKLNRLADTLEKSVDINGLIGLAQTASELPEHTVEVPALNEKVRIAAAKDEAFCFYYEDNLDLFRRMGAEIVEFSPLRDEKLPENVQGLLLPGGYPELYGTQLEANGSMRTSIREALEKGLPSLAECGGFMYLHESIEDMEGNIWAGVGVVPGRSFWTGKLGRFGYIHVSANEDLVLGKAGTKLRAHEFHYFDSSNCGESFHAQKPGRKRNWECVHGDENHCWGFPHMYYYSNPEAAWQFLCRCSEYPAE